MDPMQQMLSGSQPNDGLDKVVKSVMESLGLLYKECHRSDPSGQACQAVQQIMQAVSEVANNIDGMGAAAPPSQDPFAQASQNVGATMQQAAPPQEQPY